MWDRTKRVYLPVPYAAPLAFSKMLKIFSYFSSPFSSARISLPKSYGREGGRGRERSIRVNRQYNIICSSMHIIIPIQWLTVTIFLTKALSVLTLAFFRGETDGPIHVMNANFFLLLISSPVSKRTYAYALWSSAKNRKWLLQ